MVMEACPTQLLHLKEILNAFASSTGLRVNYNKSVMVPLNISEETLQNLATTFQCQKGSLPFTYLGLPLGTTKPNIEDFVPLMQKVEKRLQCTSMFLSQGGKLEMVNSVFSSSAVFHAGTLKLHKGVINQLDKYWKHCLWRGGDLGSKKPHKAAWSMVTLPKKQGGLGVQRTATHNDAMLMKFLHKFFNKVNVPWVKLIWDNYYHNGTLPGQQNKGSFWWKDIVKLLDTYKGLAAPIINDGSTVWFWKDLWHGVIPAQDYPHLFSFVKDPNITFSHVAALHDITECFHLPLSSQAFEQLESLKQTMHGIVLRQDKDIWSYIWNNQIYSTAKAYKVMIGTRMIHPAFKWIWTSKCQMKHKVFFLAPTQGQAEHKRHPKKEEYAIGLLYL